MLYYGRKGRLVNQPPLPEHKQTHDLLMHYENYPGELPALPPLDAPWEEKVRTHTSFQGASRLASLMAQSTSLAARP